MQEARVLAPPSSGLHASEMFQLTPESVAAGWKFEAEMKFPDISHKKLKAAFKEPSFRELVESGEVALTGPIFDGVITMWLYNGDLPPGVSARVKQTEENGVIKFYWALKCNPPFGATASLSKDGPVLLKRKLENEQEAGSFEEALYALQHAARELGFIGETDELKKEAVFKKERVSYMYERQGEEPLRLDVDCIFEINGKKLKPKDREKILEIESLSNRKPSITLQQVIRCAGTLGFVVDEKFASRSIRAYLAEHGKI